DLLSLPVKLEQSRHVMEDNNGSTLELYLICTARIQNYNVLVPSEKKKVEASKAQADDKKEDFLWSYPTQTISDTRHR
ncbi:hypothetical protein A2U01_0039664, partial [Trifolium medium]|nr:hypothetical protein [Trifolium medium]